MEEKSSRNPTVDIIRSIAMLLVIMGHTIANSDLTGYEDSLLFKLIWTLQMPLFMLVSGYVTYYSRPLNSYRDLLKYNGKKSLTYLFPWFVWTVGVRGFLFGGWTLRSLSSNLTHLLWHMDSGYWFLTSLWTIHLLWGIGTFFCRNCFVSKTLSNKFFTALITFALSMVLFLIGYFAGFSFFGVKLTCYYLPFFLLGCIFPYFWNAFSCCRWYPFCERIIICISLLVFFLLVIFRNFYTAEDTVLNIIERMVCSLCGCTGLIYFICRLQSRIPRMIRTSLIWIGSHTLEIYLFHYLFLGIICGRNELLYSLKGMAVAVADCSLTLLLSTAMTVLLEYNKYTRFIFFGKTSAIR